MTSKQCEELRSDCLDQAIEAREQKNALWEEAQMRRLHSLGNMKERILDREAHERKEPA